MLKKVILLFVVVGFVSLNSCKEVEEDEIKIVETVMPDLAAIKADVISFESKWAAAINAKDVDAVMSMWADDAMSMPEGSATLVGKEAIKARYIEEFASATGTISFETLEVYAQGDYVTEIGKTVEKDADGKVNYEGKYMAVLQKAGDSYLCVRDIWNNNSPRK